MLKDVQEVGRILFGHLYMNSVIFTAKILYFDIK